MTDTSNPTTSGRRGMSAAGLIAAPVVALADPVVAAVVPGADPVVVVLQCK